MKIRFTFVGPPAGSDFVSNKRAGVGFREDENTFQQYFRFNCTRFGGIDNVIFNLTRIAPFCKKSNFEVNS